MKNKIVSLFATILFLASLGLGFSMFLFAGHVDAGTSGDGSFTISPKENLVDNVIGATHTEWKFTATTTAALVQGDIIRFIAPTSTEATPFTITNSATTSQTGNIALFKQLGPSPVGGASSTVFATGQPFYYGFVNAAVATGTPFSITFDGINNANGATSSVANMIWTLEAGTLASTSTPPNATLAVTKFSATSTESLILNPVGTPTITNLVLADTDTTGFGLDGRDFTMTWNPGTTTPSGMQFAQMYILPNGTNLNTTNIMTACGGNPTQPVGGFNAGMYLSFTSQTPPMYMKADSCNTAFATSTSYKAWIYVNAAAPFVVSSTAVSYASAYDVVADTMAPFIDHMSVNTTLTTATSTIYAFVNDDQSTKEDFAAGTDGAYFSLVYGADVSAASTTASSLAVTANLFKFLVPTSFVTGKSTFEYYIKARDRAGNQRYFCALPPDSSTEATCVNNPFVVNVAGSLPRSISGTVLSNGAPVSGAYVFAGGVGTVAVQTNGSGEYTLTGLPDNSMVDLTAYKAGYCQMKRSETIGTADKTGIVLNINMGECGMGGGSGGPGGGAGGAPNVIFSGPPDGMQNVPPTERLRVGFNQPLDSTTVNDGSSDAITDNVYLMNNITGAVVTGTVTYCENSSSPGCSSLFSMDTNTILFTPTASLATSTGYALIVTEKVKSQGGQSVMGNRPGGGHRVSFTTVGGMFDMGAIGGSYGTTGQFMPPFVRSVNPAPGMGVAGNTKITVEFNQAMQSNTITTSNVKLRNKTTSSYVTLSSVTLDSTESRFVKITPQSSLTNGSEYEVEVYGAVASAQGITMRGPAGAAEKAFSSFFMVSSATDSTAPTLYPSLASGATAVPVNQVFEFGASEQLDFNTVNTTNITVYRGATAATVGVSYDPGKNSVFVAPISALAPNTAYTITFSPSVTDLAGNGVATTTYSYTTGSGDSVKPSLREARCDDYKCRMVFTEPMNRDTQADTNWANSAVNPANWTITKVSGSVNISVVGKPMNYNSVDYSVTVEGIAGLASGDAYQVTASSSIKDLSENAVETTSSANIFIGTAESSAQTFGSFGDMGMFSPPTSGMMGGGAVGGGTFTPQGFGNFTAEQFAFGNADQAFPFNSMAGKDVNVFQVRFKPGVALANGDKVAITFPSGTNITNAVLDTQSPFLKDASEGSNTIASSTAFAINTTERTITITYAITGTATTSDSYVIDLTKIINPSIPKGPSTGGYTVTLQSISGATVTASKTSMPYFIDAGGSNTITVSVQAGASPVSGADGTIYLHGGGPSGPMEKVLTMTDGLISAVNGTATTSVAYTSLRDGCYFVGTEPMVSLGGADYFGQMSPEPICVNGGQSLSKTITFTAASGASVPVTVKLVKTGGFGGKDIDIFAGGPGKFTVKTLTNVTTPDVGGYTLNLPANGHWNIGVGPATSKGSSSGIPQSLGVMTPPPTDLVVSGLGGTPAVSVGMFTPPGVSFNDTTDTLTITFANADKVISGTVKDGSGNALSNMEVFVNRQGFGAPLFTQTNAAGAFSLSVADNGTYEIGVSKQGMPPAFKMVDVRGSGTNYVDGKLIDGGNPFIIVMKKASYTISGKVLDADSNSISGAPLFATNATGNSVFGQSGSDGSYTLFVDNGSWTINVQMPPEKNDACGTFSKTVVVSGASQSSQNITPTTGTCVTLSGTVTAGSALANVPLFIEEWNAGTNAPVVNGFKRPASTASNGTYSVKVLTNKTYRIGTWHPDYGEISTTQAVVASNVTKDITLTADTVTFNFTGGSATMNAMIELKDSTNKNKVIRKQVNGLASSVAMNVDTGSTNSYFVDVFGYGKYSGSIVSTGGADDVTIDLSGSEFVTISGVIKDAAGNALSGAAVNIFSTSTNMTANDLTDVNGAYEIKVKAGSYQIASSLSGYMAAAPANVTFSTTTANYDFAPSQDQTPLTVSSYAISGTIYNSSSVAMSEGFVWATNASGTVVSSPTNADGTYSLPVNAGVWTVKAVGPLHAESTLGTAVTVTTGNQTGKNITLTADATRIPKSATGVLSASTGGSLNDEGTSGMKLTVGSGVLETGSGNVTVNMEKGFNAPDSASYQALDNTTFSFEASGDSSIKTLNGNAEIQLNYTDLVSKLPAGTSEANLQLMYYSPERGDYVPVEGGFTVDTVNNTVTGLVSHFTDFVLAYVPSTEGVPAAPTGVTATAASASQINLAWTAVSGATSYDVHRSATVDGTYVEVSSVSAPTVSYSNTGLAASTRYYYKITATNSFGEGASSDAATAITNNVPSGGGGSSYTPPPVVIVATTTPVAVATTTAQTTPIVTTQVPPSSATTPAAQTAFVAKIEATFMKALKKGMKDVEVTRLQTLFAKDSALYPEGDVTGYFGPATERAVQRFQAKYSLVTSGTPATTGYGALGPKTRAKILEVFSGKVVPATQNAQPSERAKVVSPVFNASLQKGMKGASVKQLQVLLNSNLATRIAETGDGSLGHETEYFGQATMKAIQKFQELYNLAKQGDAGYGFVGPKTRAKLNELSNGQ